MLGSRKKAATYACERSCHLFRSNPKVGKAAGTQSCHLETTVTDCPPRTFDAHVDGIRADIQDDLAMSDTILKARRRLCMADGPAELKPS